VGSHQAMPHQPPRIHTEPPTAEDVALAAHYLRYRAILMRKNTEPVVYLHEVETVLGMLQTGAFREWYTAMSFILPPFPEK